jgi:two-component system chemotaxis response regulator CheB
MIRVVIAEETPVMQTDPDIVVVAIAGDGQEAIRIIKRHKPDILIIDVKMPVLDGMEATRIIMQECPLPIIVTGAEIDPHDVRSSMQALQYGAVAVAEKPRSPEDAMNGKLAARLAQTVRLMAEIKVVRRVKTPEHKSPSGNRIFRHKPQRRHATRASLQSAHQREARRPWK